MTVKIQRFYFLSFFIIFVYTYYIINLITHVMKVLLFAFLLCMLSCQSADTKDSIVKMDLETNLLNYKNLKLSNLSDSIKVIALETNANCIIGDFSKLIKTKDFLLINGSDQHLFMFDLQGRFLREIGKQGRGSDEYLSLNDFAYSKKENLIYVNTIGASLKYTINGDFVTRINLPSNFMPVFTITDNNYSCYAKPYSPTKELVDSLDFVSVFSSKGKSLKTIKSGFVSKKGLTYFNWIYSKENNVYFKEEFNDNICCMDANFNKKVLIELGLGDKAFEVEHLNVKFFKEWNKHYRIAGMFDFKKYYILSVQKGLAGKNIFPVVYDKITSEVFVPRSDNKENAFSWKGIDWSIVGDCNEELIMFAQASDVLECNSFKSKLFIKNLNLESNPVILIAHVKS